MGERNSGELNYGEGMSNPIIIKCDCTTHFTETEYEYFQCMECKYEYHKKGKEMKPFKTQAEIYQHLLDGGKVTCDMYSQENAYIYMLDGKLINTYSNYVYINNFEDTKNWHPYEEPKEKEKKKKKKKIKVYGYVDITTGCTFTEKSPDYTEVSDHFYRAPELDREVEYEV